MRCVRKEAMKSLKKDAGLRNKFTILIFSASILIVVLSIVASREVIRQLEVRDFKESVKTSIRENAVVTKHLLDEMIADLEYAAGELEEIEDYQTSEVQDILESSNRMQLFDAIFVSDSRGNAYSSKGKAFNVAQEEFFKKALEEDKVIFSEVIPSKRFDSIQIIALPMHLKNGEIEGILFGLFRIDTFSHLSETLADRDEYISVVDLDGMYINCFDYQSELLSHETFWAYLEKCQLQDTTLLELQKKFCAGHEGEFSYVCNDAQRYGFYTPLGVQDWQLVLTVEGKVLNDHIRSVQKVNKGFAAINLVCLAVMLFCVYSYFKKSNDEICKANQKIEKSNEMLRMAAEFSDRIIFEYHIPSRAIELKTKVSNPMFTSSLVAPVPDCFFELNLIEKGSIQAVKKMFKDIETEKSSQADIRIITQEKGKSWYRVSMYNIYSEAGEIVGTVGSVEDISMLKKGEDAIRRKEQDYKTLITNALLYMRMDLDADMILELNGKDVQLPYQDYMKKRVAQMVIKEYQPSVLQTLSLKNLKQEYQSGKECIEVQCLVKRDQQPRWVSCQVSRIPQSGSSEVALLIMDIDEKKRREIKLQEEAERDGLTGLYNAATSRKKIRRILRDTYSPDAMHALIVLDLDNFKKINDTFGHASGDQVLIDVANVLKKSFRSSDIAGRLGGDEFVLFLCNVKSTHFVESSIKNLNGWLTKEYTQDGVSIAISASIGAAIAPYDGTRFEDLYRKADIALYQVKNKGKNGGKMYCCESDDSVKELAAENKAEQK